MSREALRSSMIGHRGMPRVAHWVISSWLTFIPVAFGTACGLAAQAIVQAFIALLPIRKMGEYKDYIEAPMICVAGFPQTTSHACGRPSLRSYPSNRSLTS
jgi:hypothetical protein